MRLAADWPDEDRRPVEQAFVADTRTVVDEEWPTLSQGTAPSATAIARLGEIWRAYTAVEDGPIGATPRYAASLTDLSRLDQARGKRLLASHDKLPGVMWSALILGGV